MVTVFSEVRKRKVTCTLGITQTCHRVAASQKVSAILIALARNYLLSRQREWKITRIFGDGTKNGREIATHLFSALHLLA